MKTTCVILCSLLLTTSLLSGEPEPPRGGALAGERFRVIVSTDLGGSDPDDFQSLVHYLVYADLFDTEGLISSPPHAGRAAHILETLDAYAQDYPKLIAHSPRFPAPDALRAVTKQGAIEPAPAAGWSEPTESSRWLIERARAADPRPLWILVWGSITDVAQAIILHIWEVWKVGGYGVYHHDMFQTGYGSPACPPHGIPDPEFSPYHRQVFEFLRLRERYRSGQTFERDGILLIRPLPPQKTRR